MIGRLALAAAALVLAPVASAQDRPADEIFADLTLGYCPMVLGGQFPLDNNPMLMTMGFPAETTPLPLAAGPIPSLTLSHAGDTVSFAGAPGRVCRVALEGTKQELALTRLREAMRGIADMGLDFKAAPDLATPMAGATVEGFKAVVEGQTLNFQLFRMTSPKTALIAQLYVTDK